MIEPETWDAIIRHPLDGDALATFRAYAAPSVVMNIGGNAVTFSGSSVGQLIADALGAVRVILYDDAKAILDEQGRADHLLDVNVLLDKARWNVVATYTFDDPHVATMFKLAEG